MSEDALSVLDLADDIEVTVLTGMNQEQLKEVISTIDGIIVRSSVQLDEEILEEATNLKAIVRAGVGVDNVDIPAASLRGIVVMNTPDAITATTAEYTFGMILSCMRRIPSAHLKMKSGGWNRNLFQGEQLTGKVLGIVGLGRVGAYVARLGLAFDMKIIARDPFVSQQVMESKGVRKVELEELFRESDVVSLHSTLTDKDKHMVDAHLLSLMQPSAWLVNTARGELVDEGALFDSLNTGSIGGAALDTFILEPLESESRFRDLDNVVLTPHLAASTHEAQQKAGTEAVELLLDALRGVKVGNALNMPFKSSGVLAELESQEKLANTLGQLAFYVNVGSVAGIEVITRGESLSEHVEFLTAIFLRGLLAFSTDRPLNIINSVQVATSMGIAVSSSSVVDTSFPYRDTMTCRISGDDGEHSIVGAMFDDAAPRILRYDDFIVDAPLQGNILILESIDEPGVVARVAKVFEEFGINIASWNLGREAQGGAVLSFIGLDKKINNDIKTKLQEVRSVSSVSYLTL